jgi:tRNA(Arg) A34 adenosine deaminase TadA
MTLALAQAQHAASLGEVPVGAVIVDMRSGAVLASAHNLTESQSDPTAHAELLAVREACRILQTSRLNDYTIYVTLEPCAMCAQALAFARIGRVVFGAYDPKGGGVEHGPRIFDQPTCHHRPEVLGGVEEQACGELLREFFKARR